MCQPANCFGKISPHGDQIFFNVIHKNDSYGKNDPKSLNLEIVFLKSPYLDNRLPRYNKIFFN
jgi:hypothetical protein